MVHQSKWKEGEIDGDRCKEVSDVGGLCKSSSDCFYFLSEIKAENDAKRERKHYIKLSFLTAGK